MKERNKEKQQLKIKKKKKKKKKKHTHRRSPMILKTESVRRRGHYTTEDSFKN